MVVASAMALSKVSMPVLGATALVGSTAFVTLPGLPLRACGENQHSEVWRQKQCLADVSDIFFCLGGGVKKGKSEAKREGLIIFGIEEGGGFSKDGDKVGHSGVGKVSVGRGGG